MKNVEYCIVWQGVKICGSLSKEDADSQCEAMNDELMEHNETMEREEQFDQIISDKYEVFEDN